MAPVYHRPETLEEAVGLAAARDAVLLAGGTDALVWLKNGTCPIESLVSLRDVPELRGVRDGGRGWWIMGASTTHGQVARDSEIGRRFPALAEACRRVGSPAVRSSATVVGNICTAAPSADSAGPLLAYGAEVVVARSPEGGAGAGGVVERVLALTDFFEGPGRTALVRGDVITAVRFPDPGPHGAAFRKLSRRRAMDIALVSVTAVVRLDPDGRCADLRLALGAVAPTPILVPEAAETARGRGFDATLLERLARSAVATCRPVSDLRASAGYRREMVDALTRAAVEEAWRAAAGAEPVGGVPEGTGGGRV